MPPRRRQGLSKVEICPVRTVASIDLVLGDGQLACGAAPSAIGDQLGHLVTLPGPARHTAGGCSSGPAEALNLLIKKARRVGHGFRNLSNYRLRLLLHCDAT
jgi:hypothetical protein